jgi:hypothetical protein
MSIEKSVQTYYENNIFDNKKTIKSHAEWMRIAKQK